MERSLTASAVFSPDHQNQIHHWQEQASSEPESVVQGVVARLCLNCQDSLHCLVQHFQEDSTFRSEYHALRRCLGSLRLWSNGHGATSGVLDAILHRSKSLRLTTISILNPLCRILSRGLANHVILLKGDGNAVRIHAAAAELYGQTRWLLSDNDNDLSGSDTDYSSTSDDDAESELQELVRGVKTHVNCLIDLGTALDCPALEPEHEDGPSLVLAKQRSAHDYHTELIKAKFPDAEARLLHVLGQTSWDRYQRMQQERNLNTRTQSTAPSGDKSQAAASAFQDSGIGTSLPQGASTYAETLVSYMSSIADGNRAHIPPLSAEAKKGESFECNACGKFIRATRSRDWRKHLYIDLRPYTCLFATCGFIREPFPTQQLWIEHLELDHQFGPDWVAAQCPLCLDTTGSGKKAISDHFAKHMEDIALASLPRDVESDADQESDTDTEGAHAGSELDFDSRGMQDDMHTVSARLSVESPESDLEFGTDDIEQSRDEDLTPNGALSHNGRPVELVSEKGGEAVPLSISSEFPCNQKTLSDEDRDQMSMARGKESDKHEDVMHKCRDCKKVFKRLLDLSKHEKSHARPWRCTEEKCKYFTLGWPTEKERDRHINDRHNEAPALYICPIPLCAYASKRIAKCEQHMEKVHGWERKAQDSLVAPQSADTSANSMGVQYTPSIPGIDSESSQQPFRTSIKDLALFQMEPTYRFDGIPFDLFDHTHMQDDEGSADAVDTFGLPGEDISPFDPAPIGNAAMDNIASFWPDINQDQGQFLANTKSEQPNNFRWNAKADPSSENVVTIQKRLLYTHNDDEAGEDKGGMALPTSSEVVQDDSHTSKHGSIPEAAGSNEVLQSTQIYTETPEQKEASLTKQDQRRSRQLRQLEQIDQQRLKTQPEVDEPTFERTYTDVASDNFYDPSAVGTTSVPRYMFRPSINPIPSYLQPMYQNSSDTIKIQRALQAAQSARSNTQDDAIPHQSPFRNVSPLYRDSKSHINLTDTATITPADAMLDYRDNSYPGNKDPEILGPQREKTPPHTTYEVDPPEDLFSNRDYDNPDKYAEYALHIQADSATVEEMRADAEEMEKEMNPDAGTRWLCSACLDGPFAFASVFRCRTCDHRRCGDCETVEEL